MVFLSICLRSEARPRHGYIKRSGVYVCERGVYVSNLARDETGVYLSEGSYVHLQYV